MLLAALLGLASGVATALWLAALLGVLLAGCATGNPAGYPPRFQSVTAYPVKADRVTHGGVRYSGALDPVDLDARTGRVAGCLKHLPEPSEAEKRVGDCPAWPLRRAVDAARFDVLLAPDWGPSCFAPESEETFPCRIDPRYCFDPPPVGKGLPKDSGCQCQCRATIQGNRTIVVTPNLRLYPAELVRLVTGCNYVWTKTLGECAQP